MGYRSGQRHNQYLIDRTAQRERRSFSGVAGIAEPDAAIQESMGPIQDRTTERLGTSDTAIIRTRALLLRCTREAADTAGPLPALTAADQHVRAASFLLPAGEPFMEHAREAMRVRAGTPYVFATPAPLTAPAVAP
jgi:phthalate 4,5-dioxygenase